VSGSPATTDAGAPASRQEFSGMHGPRVSKLNAERPRASGYWAMAWGILVAVAFLTAATISFALSGAPVP
jgi:hypothetical protein